MTEDLYESDCSVHGLDPHVLIHEAGHAVAAVTFGIPFKSVVVYGEDDEKALGGFMSAAAQIIMSSPDHSSWVKPDPVAALKFACAGLAAEFAAFDDSISGAGDSDMQAWRVGYSTSGEDLDMDQVGDELGTQMMMIYTQTLDWAVERVDDIKKLAAHLEILPRSAEMRFDEVVALLA